MKIINSILVYTIVICFLLNNVIGHKRSLKVTKDKSVLIPTPPKLPVIYVDHPPVNITDPKATVLYQFALGVADILVSDPEAANECQLQNWMIDQPTIQEGTAQWFEELAEPLSKMAGLLDAYALQPVCQKHPQKLKGWLSGALEQEQERYEKDLREKKPHENIEFVDPYAHEMPKDKSKKKNKKNDNKVTLKEGDICYKTTPDFGKEKACPTGLQCRYINEAQGETGQNKVCLPPTTKPTNPNTTPITPSPNPTVPKGKKKLFLQNTKVKKSKSKDWWKVLSLSLPLVPYHVLKYKLTLDKMMKGYLWIHFNQYVDCIAKSIDTGRSINSRLVGYRSLMAYAKNGKKMHEFGNVFSLLICNWTRFKDHISTLEAANAEKDYPKKYYLFGQAMGKFVVAIATGTDTEVVYNVSKK